MNPFVRLLRAKALLLILAIPIFVVVLPNPHGIVSPVAGIALLLITISYLAMALFRVPQLVFERAEKLAGRPMVVRGMFFGMASMTLALAASAFWEGDAMLISAVIALGIFFIAYIAAISVALFAPPPGETK